MRFVGLLPGFSGHLASLRPSPVDDGVHQVPDVFHGGPVAQCLVHIPARARQVQLVAHNLGQIVRSYLIALHGITQIVDGLVHLRPGTVLDRRTAQIGCQAIIDRYVVLLGGFGQ